MASSLALRILVAVGPFVPWLLVYLMTKRRASLQAWIPRLKSIGVFMLACSIICYVFDYWNLGRALSMYFWGLWLPSMWLQNHYKLSPSTLTSLDISGNKSTKP